MKTLIFALVFPFAFFLSSENDNLDSTKLVEVNNLVKKVEVDVEVDFGRKKKGCSGLGVCGVILSTGITGIMEGSGSRATLTVKDGVATGINFHRNSMSNETMKKYFAGKAFVIEEDFTTTIMDKEKKYTLNLKAGKFEIKKSKNGFNIGMPPN
jgi:hypothetical protein